MGLLREIDIEPRFDEQELIGDGQGGQSEEESQALWDVVFCRLSATQEYGWHAGIESLMWASDAVNGNLVDFDWPGLQGELSTLRDRWIEINIDHAKEHGEYFPPPDRFDDETLNSAE
jgi:hypothetical protein